MGKPKLQQQFYHTIEKIITQARNYAYRAVNFAMVQAYWNVGRLIVEEEQKGEERAEYGAFLIQELSKRLTAKFGKGFNERNLFYFKQFYLKFPIVNAVRAESDIKETLDQLSDSNIPSLRKELSWTHYRILLTVEDDQARYWYMNEAANCGWKENRSCGNAGKIRNIEGTIMNFLSENFKRTDIESAIKAMLRKLRVWENGRIYQALSKWIPKQLANYSCG